MKQYISEYLNWKASYAPSSFKRYGVVLKKLNTVKKFETINDVVEFRNKLDGKYSPTYINYSMTIVRDFVGYCWSQRYTDLSPKLIKPPRFTPKRRVVPTAEEIDKLVNVWNPEKFTELRNRVIILILKDSGMRLSELVRMKISDIADTTSIIQTSKGFREDVVMWSEETNRELLKYLGSRICISNGDNVWCSVANTIKISGRQVERIFAESCIKAGITKKITPHTMRHYKAHSMINLNANVKEVQIALRHSETNPRAAFQYLKLDKTETKRILKKYV